MIAGVRGMAFFSEIIVEIGVVQSLEVTGAYQWNSLCESSTCRLCATYMQALRAQTAKGPHLAVKYNITAMHQIMILKSKGELVSPSLGLSIVPHDV